METDMMNHYAAQKSLSEAVDGGGLLVVAQWEAKPGEADKVAGILDRFLPDAQREDGVKLFLMVGPVLKADAPPPTAHIAVLKAWGIEAVYDIILDAQCRRRPFRWELTTRRSTSFPAPPAISHPSCSSATGGN